MRHTYRQTHNIVFINKGIEPDTKLQIYVGCLWWGLLDIGPSSSRADGSSSSSSSSSSIRSNGIERKLRNGSF
jgi:hypothetical protein